MKKVLLFAACLFFLTGLKAQLQAKKNTQQAGQTTTQLDSVNKAATGTTASRPKTSEKNIKLMTAFIKGKAVPAKKPNVEKPVKTEKPGNK
jgi:hypothetical protein